VTEALLGRLDDIDRDLGAAEHVVQIGAVLSLAGLPIGPFDVMIAGYA
jgi:tRNA(fMet)-specific endonuclease VapC